MYFNNSLLTAKPILQQAQAIKIKWPGFATNVIGNTLKAVGDLQPTARSISYMVRIAYKLGHLPDITLLNPKIEKNSKGEMPEHLYSKERLCLYRPIYGEFKSSDLISETIIPWTALWLYHYEVWHITGDWLGGGEHPGKR
ncbi:hypothetical protein LLH06_10420 [Mucilaginibacter daejeonensis]|uniref:hypothetical protein n=1 Tax=Mucilaginibacter daejeonensis TaxID=398049 RepID=UPI001D17A7D2|nr:hypothetical protein [Mucilaginibacter daejeonensis]UEG51386.1 hypothetical protein LLH06_10420 [Mucilaginibacter daejeonensis]